MKELKKKWYRWSWLLVVAALVTQVYISYPDLWKSYYYKWMDFRPEVKVFKASDIGIKKYKDLKGFFLNDKPTLIWLNITHGIDFLARDSSFIKELDDYENLNLVFMAHGLEENKDLKNKWFVQVKEAGIPGNYVSADNSFKGYHELWKEEIKENSTISHGPVYLLLNGSGIIIDTSYTNFKSNPRFYTKLKEFRH